MPPRLQLFAFVSCLLNILNLLIISFILRFLLSPWLGLWEYLTLVLAAAAVGCSWWLVDLVDGRFHLGIDG